jgi:hypothetical protein
VTRYQYSNPIADIILPLASKLAIENVSPKKIYIKLWIYNQTKIKVW